MKEAAAKIEAERKKAGEKAAIKNNVVESGKANDRIVVSFLPEDWQMVKEYCEVNGIFYSEK